MREGKTATAVPRRPARGRAGPMGRAVIAAAMAGVTMAGVTGCLARAGAAPAIELSTAYVPVPSVPGTTVAYVVIRNNGPADRLIAARTSAGGRVVFRAAQGQAASPVRTLPAVRVPARSTLAMAPDGVYMLVTGVGPVRGGEAITLTLVFARAGAVSVAAQVTDPASSGGGFFG